MIPRNPEPAREWDELPRNKKEFALLPVFAESEQGELKEIPINRPCDWCGEIVDEGYLHGGECSKNDMKFWLEILY